MEPDGSNQLQDWGLWLHAMHLTQLKPAAVLHFSSYDQLVQAAVAGQGVALGRVPLIDRLLKAKKLVAPFADAVVSPKGYCMLVGPGAARRPRSRPSPRGWRRKHAPRVQQVRGVERALDRPHHRQRH